MQDLLITIPVFTIFLILGIRYRQIFDPIVYYIFPLTIIIYSYLFPTRELFFTIGHLSKQLLIFLLFIKPIASLFKSKALFRVTTYRRQLGLLTFWLFLVHTLGIIYLYELFSIAKYLQIYHIIALIAGLGLIILAITSNNYSVRKLQKNWKRLQYIVYPVLFGVLIHAGLAKNNSLNEIYIIGSLFIVLKILEWKKITLGKTQKTTENQPPEVK